jgi:hypothetical protein
MLVLLEGHINCPALKLNRTTQIASCIRWLELKQFIKEKVPKEDRFWEAVGCAFSAKGN